ncbi:hypothetical protein K8R03_02905 [Candidatus Kaiserbacteria bacterium]|nr:hypothetical protein [Candidatus Kaiserbacteria bacterium]
MPDSFRHIVGGALFLAALILGIASASRESVLFLTGISLVCIFTVAACFIVQPFKNPDEADEMPAETNDVWTRYERVMTILTSLVYAFGWMPMLGSITQSFGIGIFMQGKLHIIWLPPFVEFIANELNRWHLSGDAAIGLAVFFCGMFTFSLMWSVGVLALYRAAPAQSQTA